MPGEGIANIQARRLGKLIAGRLDQTTSRLHRGIDVAALSHLPVCLVLLYRHVALGAMHHRYACDLLILDMNMDGMLADLVDFMRSVRIEPAPKQLRATMVVVLCGCGADKRSAAHQREDSTAIADHHGCLLR